MATVFFTGFPGQLGSALLPRVLSRPGGAEVVCLAQPQFVERARDAVRRIVTDDPSLGADRPSLFYEGTGDKSSGKGRS